MNYFSHDNRVVKFWSWHLHIAENIFQSCKCNKKYILESKFFKKLLFQSFYFKKIPFNSMCYCFFVITCEIY